MEGQTSVSRPFAISSCSIIFVREHWKMYKQIIQIARAGDTPKAVRTSTFSRWPTLSGEVLWTLLYSLSEGGRHRCTGKAQCRRMPFFYAAPSCLVKNGSGGNALFFCVIRVVVKVLSASFHTSPLCYRHWYHMVAVFGRSRGCPSEAPAMRRCVSFLRSLLLFRSLLQ